MSFALSVIIIILLLLPGAVSIKSYYSSLSNKASVSHTSFDTLLLNGLLITIIVHCVFICLLNYFTQIDFKFLYNIIIGKDAKEFSFSNTEINKYILHFLTYVFVTTGCSYSFVKIFKFIIHRFFLDFKYSFLNNCNYWFLLFNKKYASYSITHAEEEHVDVIVLDIFIGPDILYTGFLIDFNYSSKEDKLENVVLKFAKRRKINTVSYENEGVVYETIKVGEPVNVPGDILIIPMKDYLSINVKYLSLKSIVNE